MTNVPQSGPGPAEMGDAQPKTDESTSCLENTDEESDLHAYSQTLLNKLLDW